MGRRAVGRGLVDLPRALSLLELMERFDPDFLAVLLWIVQHAAELETGQEISVEYDRRRDKTAAKAGIQHMIADLGPSSKPVFWSRRDKDMLAWVKDRAKEHGMRSIYKECERVLGRPGKMDAHATFPRLRDCIFDDLEEIPLLRLDPKKAEYFDADQPFGETVADRFEKAAGDIHSAARCRALEMPTATVFHLMRTMELVLRELARVLKAPSPIAGDRNWGMILRNVRTAIDARTWRKGERQFYDGAHGLLGGVKNAWRDECMHVDAKYEEADATRIYAAVEAFTAHLARLPRRLR